MAHRKGLTSISLAQVMAFIGVILAGYFVVGFGKVALIGHQLRNTKAELQAEVAALEAEVADLEAQKEYVQSDAYIEESARNEFKMSRPGDQVIAPMYEQPRESNPPEESEPQEPATSEPVEPWRAWGRLFFAQ